MGEHVKFFGVVLSLFLMCCVFYCFIDHIDAGRAVLTVDDDWITC